MTPTMEDILHTTIKNHTSRIASNITTPSLLSTILYRDSRPLSRRERIARRASIYWGRIRDAWLVLIGREQIGGDW